MLARQDEERRQASLLTPLHNNNINNANNNSNRLLSSHHHPFHHNNLQSTPNAAAMHQHRTPSQEHNNQNQNQNHHNQHTAIVNNQTRRSFKNHNQVKFYANNNNAQPLLSPRSASSHRRENSSSSSTDDNKTGKKMSFTNCLYKHAVDTSARDYRDGSPEKFWIDSLRSSTDSRGKHHLKKAALYQPPPVAPLDNSGLSDQSSHMRLAFEMLLDQNQGGSTGGRRGSGGTANTPTPAARLKSLFTGKPNDHKTLLGSPRLHKAIFRNSSRGDSGGESLNSPPLSPPEEEADVIPLHKEDPSSSPPTPDYPGLEYPPVFEPGTYSLSDASTILRGRGGTRDPPSNR